MYPDSSNMQQEYVRLLTFKIMNEIMRCMHICLVDSENFERIHKKYFQLSRRQITILQAHEDERHKKKRP